MVIVVQFQQRVGRRLFRVLSGGRVSLFKRQQRLSGSTVFRRGGRRFGGGRGRGRRGGRGRGRGRLFHVFAFLPCFGGCPVFRSRVGVVVSVPVRAVSRPSLSVYAIGETTFGGSGVVPRPSSCRVRRCRRLSSVARPSVVPVGGAGWSRGGFRAVPSVGRSSVVRRSSSVPVAPCGAVARRVKRAGSRRPVRPIVPSSLSSPRRGVVRRVKRKGARGLVKVLFPSGSSVGAVGVGRRCRGRGSRSFLSPLRGGRVASVLSPCPSCPSVSPRRRGRLSAGAVRPCPVGRGRGRAGCRSVSVVRGCRLFAVAGRRGRSPFRPSGSRAGVAPVAFRRGRGRPFFPVPPCGGSSWGVGRRVPPCGGSRSPVSPYP